MSVSKQFYRKILDLSYQFIPVSFAGKDLTILCLHGVAPNNAPFNKRHLSVNQFEHLIRYVSSRFHLIHPNEIKEIKPSSNSKPAMLITFDDGYLNNLNYAAPILKKYAAPASFFVITNTFHDPEYIQYADVCDFLNFSSNREIQLKDQVFTKQLGVYKSSKGETLFQYLKHQTIGRDALVKSLQDADFKEKSIPFLDYLRLMNPEQWLQLDSDPLFVIGSHTHSHYNLDLIPEEMAENELRISKDILGNVLQKSIHSIAYPDGAYSQYVKETSLEAGYNVLFAVDYRLPDDEADPLIYKRFSYSNSTTVGSNMFRLFFSKW